MSSDTTLCPPGRNHQEIPAAGSKSRMPDAVRPVWPVVYVSGARGLCSPERGILDQTRRPAAVAKQDRRRRNQRQQLMLIHGNILQAVDPVLRLRCQPVRIAFRHAVKPFAACERESDAPAKPDWCATTAAIRRSRPPQSGPTCHAGMSHHANALGSIRGSASRTSTAAEKL